MSYGDDDFLQRNWYVKIEITHLQLARVAIPHLTYMDGKNLDKVIEIGAWLINLHEKKMLVE